MAGDDTRSKGQGNSAAFRFLRATFYLWAVRFRDLCPRLVDVDVPKVLGIGDTHLENFGTWRDAEGRLAWGINDLDEVQVMPYTNDLVRLATSALLADLKVDDPFAALIDGYRKRLASLAGMRPFVLAERNGRLADSALKFAPAGEWWRKYRKKLTVLPQKHEQPLLPVIEILGQSFADGPPFDIRFRTRRAGLGSLGRPRVIAVGHWQGSLACREAKATLPSAWGWTDRTDIKEPSVPVLLGSAARATDPYARLVAGWTIRRVAPDSDKIELTRIRTADQRRLLRAMGAELANLHLAGAPATRTSAEAIQDHLRHAMLARSGGLADAAHTMAAAVRDDQREFAKSHPRTR